MPKLEDVISQMDAGVKDKFSKEAEGSSLNKQEKEVPNSEAQEQKVVETQANVEQPTVVNLDKPESQEQPKPQESPIIDIVNEPSSAIDEASVLQYLSGKLGRDVKSLEDLTPKEQAKVKLNPKVEAFQRWTEETGYDDPVLWQTTQNTDYESMDAKKIIIEDFKISKGLTDAQAEAYYDNMYGEQEYDADMLDEAEIKQIKTKNQIKQIERQLAEKESRLRFKSLKDKFAVAKDGYDKDANGSEESQAINEASKKFWSDNAQKTAESLKDMVIPIGDNKGYKMSFNDYAKENSTKFNNVEQFFASFIDKQTKAWDVEKLIKATAYYDNMEKIAKSIYKQGLSDGQKEVVSAGKNLNFESNERKTPNEQRLSQVEEKILRDKNAVLSKLNGGRKIF